jgi:hypothetical protein
VPPRLIKKSKLTRRQLDELAKYFALEVPASRAAKVMQINRHSAERVYHVIRCCLAWECELDGPLGGEVEADESYSGGRRKASGMVRSKRLAANDARGQAKFVASLFEVAA